MYGRHRDRMFNSAFNPVNFWLVIGFWIVVGFLALEVLACLY